MTSMKDIQKKSDKDLVSFIKEKREESRSFRFGVAGAGTRNVRAIRDVKKDIARGLTEQTLRAKKNSTVDGK